MSVEVLKNRKQTAFRLSEDLLIRLKKEARKENRSLNNYVENVLMDVVYRKPNEKTLEAMREAQEDDLETLDIDNFENFIDSL